jgi:5-methylcytosine-specific restriction endonuclease McrBC regulatory subunit McrC
VQPRFDWAGIGPMLGEMGWRIAPSPLKLPLLRRSERKVPLWVLSSMILVRLAALLKALTRKFEMIHESLSAPRGRVDWGHYARTSLPTANFLSLPCTFPDLRDDRLIKGAIRYTLELQVQSLQSQRHHGLFIHKLIEFAQSLVQCVRDVPVHIPTALNLERWLHRPMPNDGFLEGLQAIEWTVEERGLAGLSDLQGLPWRMPMDKFFEAWIETIFNSVARKTGAQMKTGRQGQTTHPIDWQPSYLGSQRSLVPDIWLEWDSTTMIVDAKYKRHWEELNQHSWARVEQELRESHRNDLFQVLAYASLASTESVIACLVYPCSNKTWNLLKETGRLIHKATVNVGARSIHLWLTAVPMMGDHSTIADLFSKSIRPELAA